jgi:ATP-dependent RNA helicase DeaD
MLRLTYKIRPIERMLATPGELRTRAEADMVAFLAEAYANTVPQPTHLAVARRLLTHDNAERLIAGLLADHLGAASQDIGQEAADARRAKNPAPVTVGNTQQMPILKRPEPRPAAPTPAREGRFARGGGAGEGRRRERDDREERRERPPQAALSNWEPPAEKDDDAPLFREEGTKPGLGQLKGPPHQRDAVPEGGGGAEDRSAARTGGRRDRRRGRSFPGDTPTAPTVGGDADTIDIRRPPLPAYHIEDEPTIAVGGKALPRARAREEEPPPTPGGDPRGEDDPAFTNVFLNVGRRDGLRTEDVQRLLVEKAGLAQNDIGHIRLRERITFVGIRREHCERAIQSLIGVPVGERTLNAEPARDR